MVDVTNLSTLERRLLDKLTDETNAGKSIERIVQEEFSRFETEVEAMSSEPDELGQARLTGHEVHRLPTGNQHSDSLTVVEWQCVKAAAIHYDVPDWTAKVDGSLSYEENIELLKSKATGELERAREKSHMRRA